MGIIQRFGDIMKSNINALLDKCEDPSKMVDQMLRDCKENLADVRKETAGVMAGAKDANRKVEECEASVKKYMTAATNALKSGNEDDARTLLAKKQKYEVQLVELKKSAELANANADKMRAMHDKLVNDISELEMRKDTIKAKEATARTQDRMNKLMAGSKKSESSMAAFDRMEARANKHLDAAMAEADLVAGQSSDEDLADKYASGGNSASVDDELEALKASLGV